VFSRVVIRFLGGIWNVRKKAKKSAFYKFFYNYYQFTHGSAISINAYFEGTPFFPRGMKQIVIGDKVRVGSGCVIYQQVTIDSKLLPNDSSGSGVSIGDNCYIYPGAKIIGNLTIGDNVIISPNAVVQEDISDNSNV